MFNTGSANPEARIVSAFSSWFPFLIFPVTVSILESTTGRGGQITIVFMLYYRRPS